VLGWRWRHGAYTGGALFLEYGVNWKVDPRGHRKKVMTVGYM
jgi:hypothetical protein